MLATALLLAVPIAAIVWFEAAYLVFGLSGDDPSPGVKWMIAATAYLLAVLYASYGARRPAEAVLRACRLGIACSIMMPIVGLAVLLIWVNASGRPDLGMGGLALYSIPIVALGLASVLVMAFGIGRWLAGRRLSSA